MNIIENNELHITYGLTGNYYVYSSDIHKVEMIADKIGKKKSSIVYNKKYKVYEIRIKNKKQKIMLKSIDINV